MALIERGQKFKNAEKNPIEQFSMRWHCKSGTALEMACQK